MNNRTPKQLQQQATISQHSQLQQSQLQQPQQLSPSMQPTQQIQQPMIYHHNSNRQQQQQHNRNAMSSQLPALVAATTSWSIIIHQICRKEC